MTSLSLFTFMHWRRKWQPTIVFLPEESQGQGSLVGERARRAALAADQAEEIKDRVLRAEGLLKSAHLLSAEELPGLLSTLRLGAALGLLSDDDGRTRIRVEELTALLIEAMPAGVSPSASDTPISATERNRLRAALVRDRLSVTA